MHRLFNCICLGSTLLASLFSCSLQPIAGGSASEGEAIVMGTVYLSPQVPADSIRVTARRIILTESGDSVVSEKTAITGSNGKFQLEHMADGKYIISCIDKSNIGSAIISRLLINKDSLVIAPDLNLKSPTVLIGRVLTKSGNGGVRVVIPGAAISSDVGSDGFYTLTGAPQGEYDLTFISGNTANYLPLSVDNHLSADTVFIKDVLFATEIKDADNIYGYYPSRLEKSFSIIPVKYEMDSDPAWYAGKDFSQVRYYEIVEDTLKPFWQFSAIVGISDSMVSFYGGLKSVKILMAHQMDEANALFNDLDIFNGTLNFVIDSVYQFSDSGSSQISLPPAGYDYRVIYDEAPPPNQNYYYRNARSVYHYYRPDYDNGLFGEYSLENLVWEFGLARGCIVLQVIDVLADNNPINKQGYKVPQSFMYNCHLGRVWDYYSVNLLNYAEDVVSSAMSVADEAVPASLGVIVQSLSGSGLVGAKVAVYGNVWGSRAIADSILFSGNTDLAGGFIFPVNPFLDGNGKLGKYSNLLITAKYGQDSSFTWMPLDVVGSAWFANNDTAFNALIQF